MIPKTVHYCWFGQGKIPEQAQRCIESWKKHLNGYAFKLWNEENFDVAGNDYTREAYHSGKFAFVTDYVRLYALYHFGGIYMDTDVEVLKSFDPLLDLPAFTGFESDRHVPTGMMASEINGKWAKEMLDYYENRHFLDVTGKPDLTTNVQIICGIMSQKGFPLVNGYRIYEECLHVFPKDFFCAKSRSGKLEVTNNTYCIHHFAGSWQPRRMKLKKFFFKKIVGPNITDFLIKSKRLLLNRFRH